MCFKEIEGDERINLDHLKDTTYKNKVLSICYTERILKRFNPEWLKFFMSQKKKDDYADSFMQLWSYIGYEGDV
jgi:hypothetical protein